VVAAGLVGIAPWLLVLCVVVAAAGAALQAAIGLGMGLVTAPVLGLVDPGFVPAALVVAVLPLSVGMAVRERSHVDRTGMGWAVGGRLPGVVLGSWLTAAAGQRAVAVVVGLAVLFGVLASATRLQVRTTPRNLFLAGAASGFSATAAGIGGPPMAITYQRADPATMRATLAAFFTIGGLMSVASLALAGVLGRREVQLAGVLLPGVLVGLWSARYTVARLPADRVRPIVLSVCAVSAVVLLVEEML
jgi:uncharacterized membrane protein YfcA